MAKKKKAKIKTKKNEQIYFIPLSENEISELNNDFYELQWSMCKLIEYTANMLNDNCEEHFSNMIDRYQNIAKVLNARSNEVASPLEVDEDIVIAY